MSPLALKQKRGPGFKYASNLPGSLLREQKPVKEEGDASSAAAKRRPEREETPRYRPDELLHRQPPLLSPCNLARPARPEDKLRKKRKLFDDEEDDDDDLYGRKKVCIARLQLNVRQRSKVWAHWHISASNCIMGGFVKR